MRFTLAAVLLSSAGAFAVPIHGALGPPTKAAIKDVLVFPGHFTVAETSYAFSSDGTVNANGIYAAQGKGRWKVDGSTVSGSGSGWVDMGCAGKRSDSCKWSFGFEWQVLAAGADSLVVRVISDTSEMIM